MELSRERRFERSGLLYPMMVIAAIAVIVFSIVGIASMAGWLPSSLVGRASAAVINLNGEETATPATFHCTECGVIESIRELELYIDLETVVCPRFLARAAIAPLFLLYVLLVTGCATQAPAPRQTAPGPGPGYNLSGYSAAFKEGYADACASPRRRSEQRFKSDTDYQMGWNDGSSMCRK